MGKQQAVLKHASDGALMGRLVDVAAGVEQGFPGQYDVTVVRLGHSQQTIEDGAFPRIGVPRQGDTNRFCHRPFSSIRRGTKVSRS